MFEKLLFHILEIFINRCLYKFQVLIKVIRSSSIIKLYLRYDVKNILSLKGNSFYEEINENIMLK